MRPLAFWVIHRKTLGETVWRYIEIRRQTGTGYRQERRRRGYNKHTGGRQGGTEQGRPYRSHWGRREQNGVESPEAGAPGKGVALAALGGC